MASLGIKWKKIRKTRTEKKVLWNMTCQYQVGSKPGDSRVQVLQLSTEVN